MNMIFLSFSAGSVLTAGAVVGGTGLVIGILLGIASKFLFVKTDEKVEKVRNCLPGSNCGGCGYAGCDSLAEAIARGDAPVNACTAGADIAGISEIMGTSASEKERMTAFVHCRGTCDKTEIKYSYHGLTDCRKLALIPGHGEKVCRSGCMGYGSCVSECKFNAIHVINGVAVVDSSLCAACGKCIKACPNNLISLVPVSAKTIVGCSSRKKGKEVRSACDTGCIGCGICAKQCGEGAIEMTDNLPVINFEKCTGCGKCAEKCPQKIIVVK